ncbi:nitrilase-related carbon-nitrogen hydrolase [Niveispirillum cyanobacteriorum]|uniref:Nitrilase n=1 Tax=Niveispirillum cyanobacteriorum TaxID=1612173 RepID=A0A2K9NF62_9PROT|nr:nitrilase-related carbon-nitrogen hydrolase [Niveispirillum cyanobacteriorum]AUN31196.1 nitrilase [Niveispirillum cyanobacteriorum]GGE86501.1 hydrolase [Niveispirillum cyanobacteriorum]
MSRDASYMALALQVTCHAVNRCSDAATARTRMLNSVARIREQIIASKRFIGQDVRLVVLPEYFLTGFPMGEGPALWAEKAALAPDGPEYKALGEVAHAADCFIAGNAYEQDPHFPGLYFQTSFVVAPQGNVILRYRRLISMFAPSPYDVWDRYVNVYGADAIFPVVETEIGRLAAIASEEILYPEIARAHALRGAELFVHSSSEVASPLATPKNVAKQARAIENLAYVVSANSAGVADVAIPVASTDASSKIIDYRGHVLAEAGYGESMAAFAPVDLGALRAWRRRPGMGNMLSRLPLGLFADAYAGGEAQLRNGLLSTDGTPHAPDPTFYRDRQLRVIEKLDSSGLI